MDAQLLDGQRRQGKRSGGRLATRATLTGRKKRETLPAASSTTVRHRGRRFRWQPERCPCFATKTERRLQGTVCCCWRRVRLLLVVRKDKKALFFLFCSATALSIFPVLTFILVEGRLRQLAMEGNQRPSAGQVKRRTLPVAWSVDFRNDEGVASPVAVLTWLEGLTRRSACRDRRLRI